MKLTLLGGGGFRVPLMFRTLLADTSDTRVRTLTLWDTAPERVEIMRRTLEAMASGIPTAPEVRVAQSLSDAITGADFVFSAIRVGGTEGRATDERIAHEHGVLGQETTGFGGLNYALRGIPVAVRIAELIAELAPQAYLINFTNPAGIITEVSARILGDRVIGICDSPVGLARHILTTLEGAGLIEAGRSADLIRADSSVHMDYVGLNHLGWMHALTVDGSDVLPRLLERPDLIESFEEGKLFGAEWISSLGSIPNEYLHYYYFARETRSADEHAEKTRGIFLEAQQRGFYENARDLDGHAAFELWERTRLEREATYMATNREAAGGIERDDADLVSGGYDRVALAVMKALACNEPAELIVNTPNRGRIPELPDDAVIEAPCRIDSSGVSALPVSSLSAHELALVTTVKAVERDVIEAALTSDRSLAIRAFAHHPLIDGVGVARDLLKHSMREFADLSYLAEH